MKIAELHCHSNLNDNGMRIFPLMHDSVMSVEEILNQALILRIKILAITDHDSVMGSVLAAKIAKVRRLDIIVITGAEVSSKNGHILALGITNNIPKGLSVADTVRLIHEQNGLAIPAHPFGPWGIGDEIYKHEFDSIEVWNAAMPGFVNRLVKIKGIAGSDAHELSGIGKATILVDDKVDTADQVLKSIVKNQFEITTGRLNYLDSMVSHLWKGWNFEFFDTSGGR